MGYEFRILEMKSAQSKDTSDTAKASDTKCHHTRIRFPNYREYIDGLKVWLHRFELICTMENFGLLK